LLIHTAGLLLLTIGICMRYIELVRIKRMQLQIVHNIIILYQCEKMGQSMKNKNKYIYIL